MGSALKIKEHNRIPKRAPLAYALAVGYFDFFRLEPPEGEDESASIASIDL
jgi:hypothetical protein